jgi:hypothetical protein
MEYRSENACVKGEVGNQSNTAKNCHEDVGKGVEQDDPVNKSEEEDHASHTAVPERRFPIRSRFQGGEKRDETNPSKEREVEAGKTENE